jgi:predicted transcriptional regulator
MASSLDGIPDAELKVLRTLWEKGSQTMRDLTEAVYHGGGASDYATVQKLLERLLEKGLVIKDTEKWPYVFQAALSAQDVAARVAATAAARVLGFTAAGLAVGVLAAPMSVLIGGAIAGLAMARQGTPAPKEHPPTEPEPTVPPQEPTRDTRQNKDTLRSRKPG